jgi:hypothetical protein
MLYIYQRRLKMPERFDIAKPGPTDLTWEERNPSSYLFNVEVLTKLRQAIEKFRKEQGRLIGSDKPQDNRPSDKDK